MVPGWHASLLLLLLHLLPSALPSCMQENVRLNGQSQTSRAARSAVQCNAECEAERCGHWTWEAGQCQLKRRGKEGSKVGAKGAVSGGSCTNSTSVRGTACRYTDTMEEVVCLFPFTGENPGQKTGGQEHHSCLATRAGHTWCGVRLSLANRLQGTTVQNRDIDCGQARSPTGVLLCSPPSPAPSRTTTAKTTTRPTTARPVKASPASSRPASSKPGPPGRLTDELLAQFTEELAAADTIRAAGGVSLQAGCTTRVGRPQDCSPRPLITLTDSAILRRPTIAKLARLYDNYDPQVSVTEDRTREEKSEEQALVAEVMRTEVMRKTLAFLKAHGLFTKSPAEFARLLEELWFSVYSRGKRIKGSSGFEHVFLGEKKEGKVQGFHNWLYFQHLEAKGEVNYLGHWESVDLGGGATGLSFTFKWGEEQKAFGSMMVATSPELELALYTTCLLARGEECRVRLGGRKVTIKVHTFSRPGGVRYIASAFMDW